MSYQSLGVGLNINKQYNYGPSSTDVLTLDSTDVLYVRIHSFVQRSAQSIGDLTGSLYADGTELGKAISLLNVQYSEISDVGPWTDVDQILTSDSEYSWPGGGIPAGNSYKVPVQISDLPPGQLWMQIVVEF